MDKKPAIGAWIDVYPEHCHKRYAKNTIVKKLRVISSDRGKSELLIDVNPGDLEFFFDHEIDHIPGMVGVCALRQSSLALAHIVYDVPMDYKIVLDWMKVKLYNCGELNTITTVKSNLIAKESTRGKITMEMEGTITQGNFPVMKMSGRMIAMSPVLMNKVRHNKVLIRARGMLE